MCRTKMVKILCFVVMIAVAAVLLFFALRREPPAVSQEPPAVSPSPVVPEPASAHESTPPPESSELPYDIWSDPNVLWAIPDSAYANSLFYNWFDRLDYSDQMRKAMESAEEDDLIAFNIRTSTHGPVTDTSDLDLSQIVIPEAWGSGQWLMERLEYCVENDYSWLELEEGVSDALKDTKHDQELQNIRLKLRNRMILVTDEFPRDEAPPDLATEEAYYEEVKRRLFADEEFARLYREYATLCENYMDFFRSLYLQKLDPLRELFLEKGFIPVYNEEDVEIEDLWAHVESPGRSYEWQFFAAYDRLDVEHFVKSRLWSFVGTKEQIGWIDPILRGEEVIDFPLLETAE